jgi:4-hydroxythreonine-4-phosphate dehydrogenase
MKEMPTLILTPGCPAGIGPEVLAQAMVHIGPQQRVRFVYAGTPAGLKNAAQRSGLEYRQGTFVNAQQASCPIVCLFEDHELPPFPNPGDISEDALRIQAAALQKAVTLAKEGKVHGMVTGPIRKSDMKYLDKGFLGHTEYLHAHLAADEHPPLMAFSGGPFLLGLATIHIPLNQVSASLKPKLLQNSLRRLKDLCTQLNSISTPKLVVLGLNPHAGEDGLLGTEEQMMITPALQPLRDEGMLIQGPVSADGFFARCGKKDHQPDVHGVLAMFHDQGLAPYKILSAGAGVNITCGLKIVRTSPDHGTADDIAGKKSASPDAMTAAIKTCLRLMQV